jgi:hypothetical protein
MKNKVLLLPALLIANAPLIADAQETPAPQEPIAQPTCKKPLLTTRMRKADDDSDFNEKFAAYQSCIKAYAEEQNKLGQRHLEAANAAVAEFNAFVKQVNEAQLNGK